MKRSLTLILVFLLLFVLLTSCAPRTPEPTVNRTPSNNRITGDDTLDTSGVGTVHIYEFIGTYSQICTVAVVESSGNLSTASISCIK